MFLNIFTDRKILKIFCFRFEIQLSKKYEGKRNKKSPIVLASFMLLLNFNWRNNLGNDDSPLLQFDFHIDPLEHVQFLSL